MVVMDGGSPQLTVLLWDLVPFWAKDEAIGNKITSARCETLAAKPAFRSAAP